VKGAFKYCFSTIPVRRESRRILRPKFTYTFLSVFLSLYRPEESYVGPKPIAFNIIICTIVYSVLMDSPHIRNSFFYITLIVKLAEELRRSCPEDYILNLQFKEG
jgi:hypothetical protein